VAITARLLPGRQYGSRDGRDLVGFGVAADGTVAYDAALEGALTGRGTTTLVLQRVRK
jgi:hypothetical protein